ncbi:MAG: T9SS type A sorting domain-containing protein [Flavobacteriales bacterium]
MGLADVVSAGGLGVWPNPASDQLFVKVPNTNQSAWIHDATGRVCGTTRLVSGTNALSLAGLGAGAYVLRLEGGEVLRFVKE